MIRQQSTLPCVRQGRSTLKRYKETVERSGGPPESGSEPESGAPSRDERGVMERLEWIVIMMK